MQEEKIYHMAARQTPQAAPREIEDDLPRPTATIQRDTLYNVVAHA